MRNGLSKLQFLLLALLLFALSGCGANSVNTAGTGQAGTITAKLVVAKQAAKKFENYSAGTPTKTRLKVTGKLIPTANVVFTGTTGGTISVYPGSELIITAELLDNAGKVVYEGFATDVEVLPNGTTTKTIVLNYPVNKPENLTCLACHDNTKDATGQNLVADYKQSGHYANLVYKNNTTNGSTLPGCAGCHGTKHDVADPAKSGRCYQCHNDNAVSVLPHNGNQTFTSLTNFQYRCNECHNAHNTKAFIGSGCTICHAVPQNTGAGFVQDNNGVRSITQEFTKWSHHVTGVALNDAHCAACHLEGKISNGKVAVDTAYHMADATTHLRNAVTDADMQWDPANPDHTIMDNFCMSCHSATGAISPMSVKIQAFINGDGVAANSIAAAGKTASPTNPFGDTISNRYDKMQRPAVINVDGQFDTANNSHHAVKGKKYTGRTRFVAAEGRRIASPATFATNSSATLFGARMTIYDAVTQDGRAAFNALYAPLGTAVPPTAATSLGDDSTLHCGDCHTVGQWKAGVATNAAGDLNTAVIGAHGSNNEYLLRNDKGTDARHTQDAYTVVNGVNIYSNQDAANLVCFNCHSYTRYGSVFAGTGTTGPHAGEYDANGRCNGVGNTIPFNGYTSGKATDGTQFESRFMGPRTARSGTAAFAPGYPLPSGPTQVPTTGEQDPDFGNVFGIACANCHNSGAGNAYGGIHGSKNNQTLAGYTNNPAVTGGSYIDGMGNTTKIMRFLPGLGDAMHVPGTLGGVTGGTTAVYKNYSAYAFARYTATSSTNRTTRGILPSRYFIMPVRDNRPIMLGYSSNRSTNVATLAYAAVRTSAKVGSYNYTTTGITNDTNWEQKGWKQSGPNSTLNAGQQQAVGAGCYTLGSTAAATPGTLTYVAASQDNLGAAMNPRNNVMDGLKGPSQDGGATTPELFENWGGCDDHSAPIAGGNHGFIKRIVRPVTY